MSNAAQAAHHAAEHATSPVLQTLAISIVAGVFLVLASRRLRVSAIVLLLLGGVVLGPQAIGWVRPDTLRDTLGPLINLAVGLILFEGGLTLNIQGYKTASATIRRLLTFGVLITWFGTAGLIYTLFSDAFPERPVAMSFLAASLVIVTGPTVIAPLLRRIRIRQNIHDILHWEGVLIDPIGVFIAVLMYEYFTGGSAEAALGGFFQRVLAGLITGVLAGLAADYVLRKRWVPEDSLNIFIVAVALLIFAFDDFLVPESGLLGVTVAGLVLGWRRPGPLKQIKEFKAEISELLIGSLFILLAAQLEFSSFQRFGWKGLLLVLGVVFVIRPISVAICSLATPLSFKERLFLSYVAPRGIVAASLASLFAIQLSAGQGDNPAAVPGAWFLVPFTFSVIGFTVILQGTTAGLLARLLGLKLPQPTGWLIVGAHPLARQIARFLRDKAGLEVLMVDLNRRSVAEAAQEGFRAFASDARDLALQERDEFRVVGNVLALTDNEELNVIICQRWLPVVGREHVYRWGGGASATEQTHEQPGLVVWSALPKPTLLSSEISRHEVELIITEGGQPRHQTSRPLLMVAGGTVTLDPIHPAHRDRVDSDEGIILSMRRETDYLQRSLRPDLVVRLESAESQEQLFRELVAKVTTVAPRVDKERTVQELLERERSFPTALGHGVAVPHAYSGGIDRRLCVVAQIPDGAEFGALDGEPVRLVFLLISPQGDPEGHLATMGQIARLVSDEKNRERLMKAPDPADIVAIVESVQ